MQTESTRQEKSHHSEGAGETAVWSEAKGEKERGKKSDVKYSRETTGSRAEQKQVQESSKTGNLVLAISANW